MSSLSPWGRTSAPAAHLDDAPLLLSLFNLDQLDAHARRCAASCQVSLTRTDERLVERLRDNQRRLGEASERLDTAHREGQRLSPGAEWMLDNQHIIEEQLRLAKNHLPGGYSRALPHLTSGELAGYPRVYHLALEVIAHVDGRVDAENLTRFVTAWQDVTPLTLGELWAIPIMLRLALIENLRRVSSRLLLAVGHREQAQRWAGLFQDATLEDPKSLLLIAADMARAEPPLSNAFVAELVQRLQARSGLIDIPLHWISHRLAELGSSVQSRVEAESSDQAANQVSVSSSIGSLRFLDTVVWRDFVEGASRVEALLCEDPAACYAAMDFATRDRYRHAVEDLARLASVDEIGVAALAMSLAGAGVASDDGDLRATHVGHYLIGAGLPALMDALPGLSWRARIAQRWGDRLWIALYFGTMLAITAACAGVIMAALPPLSLAWQLVVWPLMLIATSQLGVFAANWLATTHRAPRVMPRMDLSAAIPDDARAMVIVPTMLSSAAGVEALLEGLEVRYLGNTSDNLSFGLLTDLRDATAQHMPEDAALIDAAVLGIKRLNERHGAGRFFLFHRGREWHAPDARWMGYERKRGKLEALNHLLRGQDRREGAAAPAFEVIVGDVAALGRVAFVITLDTDTGLPRNAGHKLIGAMAHPLNRPRFDAASGCVIEGHAILQPRVAINLPSARRSWFVRLYGGAAGTDPYSHVVSDVYQDLFDQGSFVGKGIYDVDAFMRAVETRLPDNLILSHDLIEGCFARSGLVSDVTLYEDHPSHVLVDAARRRRWTRGDWQLLWWISPWAPDRAGVWRANALSALSRWKLADNLRRSVVPLATLGATVVGLLWLKQPAIVVAGVLVMTFAPPLLSSLGGLLRRPGDGGLRAHLSASLHATGKQLAQAAVGLAFMPEDARNNMSSISRAATRMLLTRRLLLEWPGATDSGCMSTWSFFRAMGVGPLLAAGLLVARLARGWGPLDLSLLLLAPWMLAPWIAAWLIERASRPRSAPPSAPGCAGSPAPHGATSSASSGPRITACRPTTCRSTPRSSSLTAPRPPTWACRCSAI
jgi:cyclic beta-1,2-glucan synthetase